jgi:hypothetical protein
MRLAMLHRWAAVEPERRAPQRPDRRAARRGGRRRTDPRKPWWQRKRLWLATGSFLFFWWRRLRGRAR